VVIGRGDVVGAELVRHPDVAKISFTGLVAVGQSIMRDGAETMKRITLELGGKSPTILLDDATSASDPDRAGLGLYEQRSSLRPQGHGLSCRRNAWTQPSAPLWRPCTHSRSATRPNPKTAVGPMATAEAYEARAVLHPQRR